MAERLRANRITRLQVGQTILPSCDHRGMESGVIWVKTTDLELMISSWSLALIAGQLQLEMYASQLVVCNTQNASTRVSSEIGASASLSFMQVDVYGHGCTQKRFLASAQPPIDQEPSTARMLIEVPPLACKDCCRTH